MWLFLWDRKHRKYCTVFSLHTVANIEEIYTHTHKFTLTPPFLSITIM